MPVLIPQIRRIEFNDEEIGMGFNSETGLAIGTALEGFTIQDNPVAPGQEVTASISIVNSHDELNEKLMMGFEAQGRYGTFSGSLKAQFSESTNYNSTSTFLIARCIVQNSLRRGKDFRVKENAQRLLDALRFDEFKRAFGDSFVRGLQTGGEFYCVIRITSVSTQTQQQLSVLLQAEYNGLVGGGSFKGAFEEANRNEHTRTEHTATMYQRAGTGQQISPTVDIGQARDRFQNFPAIVFQNPVSYETEVATYDTIPLQVPTPEEQETFVLALQDARAKKMRYIRIKNDLEFARANPIFFDVLPDDSILVDGINIYTKLFNAVSAHAIALSRGQIIPPRLFDPSLLNPPLQEPPPIPLPRVPTPPPAPNAMPNLVGEFARPVIDLLGCVSLEGVDHCLAFLSNSLAEVPLLHHDARAIGDFFFHITRNGVQVRVSGNASQPGVTIQTQFPPAGVLLTPGAVVTLNF